MFVGINFGEFIKFLINFMGVIQLLPVERGGQVVLLRGQFFPDAPFLEGSLNGDGIVSRKNGKIVSNLSAHKKLYYRCKMNRTFWLTSFFILRFLTLSSRILSVLCQ